MAYRSGFYIDGQVLSVEFRTWNEKQIAEVQVKTGDESFVTVSFWSNTAIDTCRNLAEGDAVKILGTIRGRMWNLKSYTQLSGELIERVDKQTAKATAKPTAKTKPETPEPTPTDDSDLPF